MAGYPPYLARLTNFQRDANNGLEAPSPAGVDSELNNILNSVNQALLRLRSVTNPDGQLVNFSAATAQALAGTQDFTATAAQTAFLTTITWTAAFTSANVFVFVNNVKLATTAVTVANNGGFLQVTIAAQSAGNIVTVAAFESGAGLLSRLQTVSATQGASLIAINDAGGFFTAVQVEAALQELATDLDALTTAIGATAGLIRANGTVPMAANLALGGFKITGLADGTAATDAVTVGQLSAYTAVWNALQSYFLRLDGSVPMGGALAMGANKITGLANGTDPQDAVTKAQLDTKLDVGGGGLTGDLDMGGFKITNMAPGVADTDAVTVAQAQSLLAPFSTLTAYQASGTSIFTVPAGVTKIRVEVFGAGGGGYANGAIDDTYGGGGGAFAMATLTVTPGQSLTIDVGAGGAGGAVPADGGTSKITDTATATILVSAGGGQDGQSAGGAGVGGVYAFDASVTGFGIPGSRGDHLAVEGGTYGNGSGGDCPRGGAGGFGYRNNNGGGIVAAQNGVAPGGGGGGGNASAGAGAAGAVLIWY